MPREIWLGPILNSNRTRLVERCRQMLREGRAREFVYLAATRPLMESVSSRLLEGDVAGTTEPLNVYLLSGFSRRVFARAKYADTGEPLPFFAPIDTELRPVQRPLFGRMMARLAEAEKLPSFGALARMDGLVSTMTGLVAEIQRAGKTAEEFRQIVGRREALDAESKPTRERPPETEPEQDEPEERREARRIAAIDYDRDTALVYGLYERLLDENRLTDASRDYLRALAVLRGDFFGRPVRVPFLEEARLLIVDGFFDILPVHAEIVSLLVRRFPETIVNLNEDRSNPDAFRAFRDVVERFGERSGFAEHYTPECAPVAPGLHSLRRDLFNTRSGDEPDVDPAPEVDSPPEPAVTLLHAPDRLREVRAVAKRVKRLVLEHGLAPHEIAVVYRNRDRYEAFVRDVFRDEAVAVSLGERRSITDLPAARAAMKVLDAAISNRTREGRQIRVSKVVAVLKSDFFALSSGSSKGRGQAALPFDEPESAPEPAEGQFAITPDEVENAVAFVGAELNLDDWLRRAHRLVARLAGDDRMRDLMGVEDYSSEGGEDDDEATPAKSPKAKPDFPVDTLRKAVGTVDAVGQIVLSIPYEAAAADMAEAFRDALRRLSFESRLRESARRAALEEEALRRAALDLRAADALDRAVDAVVEAARLASVVETPKRPSGDTRLTRNEFRADLQRAMDANQLLIAPEAEGAVRAMSATDMRGMSFAAVFVLGLVEGEFPERARGDWVYPQHERENFKEVGLPLEDLSPDEALRNEEHYFYQVACRATQRLFLCRPLAGDDDSETIPSYFVAEVVRAVGDRGVETVVTSAGFDGETLVEASTPAELARAVVRAERIVETLPDRAPAALSVVRALGEFAREPRPGRPPILSPSARRRIGIESVRETGAFDEHDGLVREPRLVRLLDETFAAHIYSASELNEYGNCSFRFFLKRVLGLGTRVEAALDLQALDVGVLLHSILRRLFERYRGRRLADIAADELRLSLDAVSGDVFDAFENGMPPLNPKLWKIERRTLSIMLDRMLQDELELQRRLVGAGMAPRYLELAFGMPNLDADPESSPEPLVIRRGHGPAGAISLRGQIDRVDVSHDGHVVAYDYKTSRGPRVADMEAGRDLQLGIYLLAVEELFARSDSVVAGGGYYALKPVSSRRNNGLYRADMREYTDIGPTCKSSLDPQEWTALRERIRGNLWDAYDRIRGGDYRVSPSQDEKTCTYCDYPKVCRFDRHRIQLKRRFDRPSRRVAPPAVE